MNQALLQNLYLFKGMSHAEMETIAKMSDTTAFAPRDTVFLKGEQAKALYLIKYGSIKIQQTGKSGDMIDVATLGAGSHFGEMALIDGETRSATATAAERTELIVLSYEKLTSALKANNEMAVKFYKALATFLCGRLRATTTDLSYAKEKNLTHF